VYQVQTDSQVREQLAALPIVAVLAFLEAVSVLERVPWNGTPVNPDNPAGVPYARCRLAMGVWLRT
jgi:hypothetical protein